MAGFALQADVRHELHLDVDLALALADLTAAAVHVEAEVGRFVAAHLGGFLLAEELADVIPRLHIGHGVAARRTTDRVLVHHFHSLHLADVASQFLERAGPLTAAAFQLAAQGGVEDALHQGRLTASAHAGHHGEHVQRKGHVDVLQVVLARTLHRDAVLHRTPPLGPCDLLAPREVLGGEAIAGHQLVVRAAEDHFATVGACFRPHVDDVVRGAHHLFVVLHHDHGVAEVAQLLQHVDQPVRVARMQADTGFVQDVHAAH